jgi:hypothetical protein
MKTASLFLLLFFFITGCSENNDPVSQNSSSIYGKWEITSGNSVEKYRIIENDNTWHSLIVDQNIFRYSFSGVCIISPGQINFGSNIMNFSVTGYELKLYRPGNTITAIRNNSAPEFHEWIKPVSPVDSILTTQSYISDITSDGVNIWWRNGLKVYKLNTTTKMLDSITISKSLHYIEWGGGYLWGYDYSGNSLVVVNPANGNFVATHSTGIPDVRGLAFDGNDLWLSGDNNVLFKYDINLKAITDSVTDFTGTNYDFTFSNGYFYLTRDRVINKCSLRPLQVVASYRVDDIFMRTITSGSGSFWAHGSRYSLSTSVNAFYKIELK